MPYPRVLPRPGCVNDIYTKHWLFPTHGDVQEARRRAEEWLATYGTYDQAESVIEEFVRQWALRTPDEQIAAALKETRRLEAAVARAKNTPEFREFENAGSVAKDLVLRHPNIVNKFVEIAYRRVSVKDEYGDENLPAILPELERCLTKLAAASGGLTKSTGNPQNLGLYVSGLETPVFAILLAIGVRSELKKHFAEYHAKRVLEDANIANLDQMTGVEFETHIMALLSKAGYDVRGTPVVGDKGADIIAQKAGAKVVIQAKRSSAPVGLNAVQEVVAALRVYGGTEAWVVTNSTFTTAANELARHNSVRLVSGSELRHLSESFG